QRALRARHAVLHDLGEPAPRVEPQQLDLDRDLPDPLADDRLVRTAALAGEVLQLLERDAHAGRRGGPEARALVHQRRDRDTPAAADAAGDAVDRNDRQLNTHH